MLYLHAFYWSIVTISHIGVGDITAITVSERAFNCFVVLTGTFAYAILFGNIAALVNDNASEFRKKVQDNYHFVIQFMHKKGLSSDILKQAHEYFSYIWSKNMGIDEMEILEELPANLMCDTQLSRYAPVILNSTFFKDEIDEVDF